ncbi:MAG: GGDEF domain-containing protein [Microgenomates group bacterium]
MSDENRNIDSASREHDTKGGLGLDSMRNSHHRSVLNILDLLERKQLDKDQAAKVIVANFAQIDLFAREVHELTHIDELTGSLNRRGLDLKLAEIEKRRKTYGILRLDIDHFKEFNDIHGHKAGDTALKSFVGAVSTQIREPNEVDAIARVGGEEFIVILPEMHNLEELKTKAEKIRECVAQTPIVVETDDQSMIFNITVSLGGTMNFDAALPFDKVDKKADALLYGAKQAGRNQSIVQMVDK